MLNNWKSQREAQQKPFRKPRPYWVKGQLSIFFAMTILTLITCMAFIINVGLFVKAKINLQNAVDAAAWSGAAVQARQLSQIAYVNWAMRNVYKEWMFKYWVLGTATIDRAQPNWTGTKEDTMDFRLQRLEPEVQADGDFFNIPSICVDVSSSGGDNICFLYDVPGIPRFENLGLPGVDETHNAFMDIIVKEKTKDCTTRSLMNFLAAQCWAYNTSGEIQDPATPTLGCDRPGAWPKAFELGIRIRNLEKLVNEPSRGNLCAGGRQCEDVSGLEPLPQNERAVKAFWSGYRNLENKNPAGDLKSSFKLTELAPKAINFGDPQASHILIKGSTVKKQYLDLKLMLINYVTFYHLFTSTSGSAAGAAAQGACSITKVALPIPGYPLGYFKNPEMLTYYAVRGEVEYVGMFNPFQNPTPMKAYAAAKPFGGRIGPMLFYEDDGYIKPRPKDGNPKSLSYAVAINSTSVLAKKAIGKPIPSDKDFWADPGQAIGGAKEPVQFIIPNLHYDSIADHPYDPSGPAKVLLQIEEQIDYVGAAWAGVGDQQYPVGLYDRRQYELFQGNLPNIKSGRVSYGDVRSAIPFVHAPTHYEALNYLIPNSYRPGRPNPSTPPTVPLDGSDQNNVSPFRLYAPLFGPGTHLPGGATDLAELFDRFLKNNEKSVETYINALLDTANEIISDGEKQAQVSAAEATDLYTEAARGIHDSASASGGGEALSCKSIAGRFQYFYMGKIANSSDCKVNNDPIQTLQDSIKEYWDKLENDNSQGDFASTFISDLGLPPIMERASIWTPRYLNDPFRVMTGYMPTIYHGGSIEEGIQHPVRSSVRFMMNRNYYSTKFVTVDAVANGGRNGYYENSVAVFAESGTQIAGDIKIDSFRNSLSTRGELRKVFE